MNKYLTGFGNNHQSEAVPNVLPITQNSPQKSKFYAEQLSGTAFTAPRHKNLKTWLYKLAPSVLHSEFKSLNSKNISFKNPILTPNQLRWRADPDPAKNTDFISGIKSVAYNDGAAIYLYATNTKMDNKFFSSSDGELLLVPYNGELQVLTEMGELILKPKEILVIPRGIKFQITPLTDIAQGYMLENYGSPLTLPELGPIGANGLANPRHFLYPNAKYFATQGKFQLICKYHNKLWQADTKIHPLNTVAWHGNYAPYKYNLELFNTINTVSFDHPDPSIFTVLTSPSTILGTANVDFVIFPPRWMVAENTFRPPYYHRNIMSEYMGLICGRYDAKGEDFTPGGSSLHNTMAAHGPDYEAYKKGTNQPSTPEYYDNTLAFMFESNISWAISEIAFKSKSLDKEYLKCWQDIPIAKNT